MYTRANDTITDLWTDLMDVFFYFLKKKKFKNKLQSIFFFFFKYQPNVTSSNYDAILARFKYNFAENYNMSRVNLKKK